MIRSPLGLRLDPARPIRDQIRGAARAGARGVVFDAAGELGPAALTESGRRELRHLLRSVGINLTAISLPTRRGFDTLDQLEDRLRRADSAFALAYDLGTRLVVARVGPVPEAEPDAKDDPAAPRAAFTTALTELGRRADHRGVVFALEVGAETATGVAAFLYQAGLPTLAASLDPAGLQSRGVDPAEAIRELNDRLAHVYATDAGGTSRTFAIRGAGRVDWDELIGALEEVGYRGGLTVWPEPGQDPATRFAEAAARLGAM